MLHIWRVACKQCSEKQRANYEERLDQYPAERAVFERVSVRRCENTALADGLKANDENKKDFHCQRERERETGSIRWSIGRVRN